jgi:hypothetical protein
MCFVYTVEYYSAMKKNETLSRRDATRDLYVKWNKADSEGQISHVFAQMRNLDLKTHMKVEEGLSI